MPNPWILIGLGLAWIASLVAVGSWQRDDGATDERARWQARELEQAIAAANKRHELDARYRAAEQEHATRLAAVSADYQRRLSDAQTTRRADAAAVRAGTLVLRDHAAAAGGAGGGCVPGAATAAGGRDGPAPGELSPAAAGFLLELAADADEVAVQLGACQTALKMTP